METSECSGPSCRKQFIGANETFGVGAYSDCSKGQSYGHYKSREYHLIPQHPPTLQVYASGLCRDSSRLSGIPHRVRPLLERVRVFDRLSFFLSSSNMLLAAICWQRVFFAPLTIAAAVILCHYYADIILCSGLQHTCSMKEILSHLQSASFQAQRTPIVSYGERANLSTHARCIASVMSIHLVRTHLPIITMATYPWTLRKTWWACYAAV